jgi:carboxylesterase type B
MHTHLRTCTHCSIADNTIFKFTSAEKQLAIAMANAWTNFAKRGDPNVRGWDAFEPEQTNGYAFRGGDDSNGRVKGLRLQSCSLMDEIGYHF